MVRRRCGVAVLAAVLALMGVQAGAASSDARGAPDHQVRVSVVRPSGTPLAGAQVRVHLDPANAPIRSHPALVAKGVTDARGRFGFDLAGLATVKREAQTNADHVVDLDVDVVSFGSRLAGYNHLAAPINKASRVAITAAYHVPRGQIVRRTAARSTMTESYRIVDQTRLAARRAEARGISAHAAARQVATRWVKVAGLYISKGMSGYFRMSKGRDTYAQVSYEYGSGPWKLGGMASEARSRSASASTATHHGPWRHVVEAEYRVNRYAITEHICDRGYCWDYTIGRRDRIYHWTGGLRARREQAARPRLKDLHHSLIGRGQGRTKDTHHNHRFGTAFTLHGFGVDARAGYSGDTRIHWHVHYNCRRNYLGAYGDDWPYASGNVYAYSFGCSR
ncbi:hypothetical protein [Nocardioides terrisoli]|uniref:hypothetical protein n=1 Tax=Nocardioides terrisoli TaxID=3388267 RepID=UPI00287B9960|nr:hypothetical protein [Nocardioides marmorisolisilvae]